MMHDNKSFSQSDNERSDLRWHGRDLWVALHFEEQQGRLVTRRNKRKGWDERGDDRSSEFGRCEW